MNGRGDTFINPPLTEEFQGSLSICDDSEAMLLEKASVGESDTNIRENFIITLETREQSNMNENTYETGKESHHEDDSDTYSDLFSEVDTDEDFQENNAVLLMRSKAFQEKCSEGKCNHAYDSSLTRPIDKSLIQLEPSRLEAEEPKLKMEVEHSPEKQNSILVDDDDEDLSGFIQEPDERRVAVGPHLVQTGGNCLILAQTEDGDYYSVDLEEEFKFLFKLILNFLYSPCFNKFSSLRL